MKSAVIVFPGSNCDRDAATALAAVTGKAPLMVWHGDSALPAGLDLVILPGGFSYGDYLRSGAMAAHSPIMQEVKRHAGRGGLVLGICNGFQILTEAGLLPGTLLRNRGLKFVCHNVWLRVENTASTFTRHYKAGEVVNIPIAHHDGNYFADADTLGKLQDKQRIAFRYSDARGEATPEANPNGSLYNIAGILSEQGNVLGMMPHPERHTDALLGGTHGTAVFTALAAA